MINYALMVFLKHSSFADDSWQNLPPDLDFLIESLTGVGGAKQRHLKHLWAQHPNPNIAFV